MRISGGELKTASIPFSWPTTYGYGKYLEYAINEIKHIFSNASAKDNEDTTVNSVIIPILHKVLGFQESGYLRQTYRAREGGGSYKADFSDIEGGNRFVIECKKMGQNLLTVSNTDKSFASSIDQAVKYLDHYKSTFSLVTNGFQWICFKKFYYDFEDGAGRIECLAGLRFRLDSAIVLNDEVGLRNFIHLLNFRSLAGIANSQMHHMGSECGVFYDALSDKNRRVFIADFGHGPLKGPGVGFNQWPRKEFE